MPIPCPQKPTAPRFGPRAFAPTLVVALVACGPSYPESEYPSEPPPGVAADGGQAPAPPGTVWRRDVEEVVDAGLGFFLQRAELEPEVEAGNFIGFRVVALRPADWWQGVDLEVGDVITQVNGMPIEQPSQAHAAFESLRDAKQIVVSYVRAGEPRELSYSILDKPLPAPTGPAPVTVPEPEAPAAP